jgi:hypothetical protein
VPDVHPRVAARTVEDLAKRGLEHAPSI